MFNQTLTATGRLSSSEPNLQNIPVRSEEGREIRKMFVSSFKDGLICSADYSQIELRLLANFSDDETMIEAFNNGQDIHAKTASEIFGIPLEMVDSARRRDAKAINFGIVYGISDFGLSQNIGITRKEASNYIKMYFERYPKIDNYLKGNVEFANNNGYVRTLYGRVRPIPEIKSNNHNLRTFGERVAMNMPLQGSASDIIKLAMIKIYNSLKEKGLKSKLILQVHDELIVECPEEIAQSVAELISRQMEQVAQLTVPLLAEAKFGNSWYEAK
jgi:DNA polymerase-1